MAGTRTGFSHSQDPSNFNCTPRHRENPLKTTRFRGEALRTKSVVMIFISHILSSALDHEVYQEHFCAVLIINLVNNTMTIICGWWTLGWSAVSDSIFPSVLWIWDDWDEGSNKTLNSLHDNRTLVRGCSQMTSAFFGVSDTPWCLCQPIISFWHDPWCFKLPKSFVNSDEPKTIIFRIRFISIRFNRICVTYYMAMEKSQSLLQKGSSSA